MGDAAIERAAVCLNLGAIIVHPTSTVYGVGGRSDPDVAARIAKAKGREIGPLIHLAGDVVGLRRAVRNLQWNLDADRLAGAFWPGPLTIVLEDGTPSGIAVRIDGHPVVGALLERAGSLLTSTSLNSSGRRPARTRDEVREVLSQMKFLSGVGGWLDAGDLPVSHASTLVSVQRGNAVVLREGAITHEEIESVLGKVAARPNVS